MADSTALPPGGASAGDHRPRSGTHDPECAPDKSLLYAGKRHRFLRYAPGAVAIALAAIGVSKTLPWYAYFAHTRTDVPKDNSMVVAAAYLAGSLAIGLWLLSFRQYHRYRSELQALIEGKLDKQQKIDEAENQKKQIKAAAEAIDGLSKKIDELIKQLKPPSSAGGATAG